MAGTGRVEQGDGGHERHKVNDTHHLAGAQAEARDLHGHGAHGSGHFDSRAALADVHARTAKIEHIAKHGTHEEQLAALHENTQALKDHHARMADLQTRLASAQTRQSANLPEMRIG